jgi:SHS2 domain-containing protein
MRSALPDGDEAGQKVTHRFLPHTADIKVAFETDALEALFVEATEVMRGLLAGTSPVEPREERPVELECSDVAELFLAYLKELVYQFAANGFLVAGVEIDQVDQTTLRARALGEALDPERHEHQPEVKAVTRHDFMVENRKDRWFAEVVFDV